jgi:hypothetical protein
MAGMTRSVKLGLAGLLLIFGALVPPLVGSGTPISFAFAVISCVLGFLAAQQGSKWWLAIPGGIIIAFSLLLFIALDAT